MRGSPSIELVREQLHAASGAVKCHRCGCFQDTVTALAATEVGAAELGSDLERARACFSTRAYDCLGCEDCFPAIAANAFTEAHPEAGAALALCPTEAPAERSGWPPLPGAYAVVAAAAPVAVCTLNDDALAAALAADPPAGLAIVGTLHTENLGIERVVRNVVANPSVRWLVLCGADTQQAIGHLPGQSLVALFEGGVDDAGRIVGARGKRPLLKNVTGAEVEAFRAQVELVPLVGEADAAVVRRAVERCATTPREAIARTPFAMAIEASRVPEPTRLVLDPAGYFVVYPDRARGSLLLEHYTNAGVLDRVLEAATPAALCAAAIEEGLVSRLDHAAYLGRELARAERSLATGEPFVQDRAPGEIAPPPVATGCGCKGACAGGPR